MSRFTLVTGVVLALLAPRMAMADYYLRSPYEIDLGELEMELNGAPAFDRRPDSNGAQSYTLEIGTGVTSWWHSVIELAFDRAPGGGQPMLVDQVVTENMIQLTEPGQEFADFGFYFEYGQSLATGRHAGSNQVTFGPAIGMDIGRTTQLVNLFLTRELGPNQSTHGLDFSYAWQNRWNLWTPLSPAIEVYGDSGGVGRSPRFAQQQLLVGPVAVGAMGLNDLGLGKAGKVKYELGWLFGATQASAQGTLRWRLELEVPF